MPVAVSTPKSNRSSAATVRCEVTIAIQNASADSSVDLFTMSRFPRCAERALRLSVPMRGRTAPLAHDAGHRS